jgi:hypothetical protein
MFVRKAKELSAVNKVYVVLRSYCFFQIVCAFKNDISVLNRVAQLGEVSNQFMFHCV